MQYNFQAAVSDLENNVLPENWEWVASSRLAKVAKFNGTPASYYKEFIPKSPLEKFKAKVRGSRCEIWVKQAAIGQQVGFDVPTVLATGVLENNNHYLITAAGPSTSVPDYLVRKPDSDEKSRRHGIKAFGRYIGEMHKAGIVHGDLRAGNILMEAGEQPQFMMIDIERNSFHKTVPMHLVRKNLVQLIKRISFKEFSARDRITFFRAYNQAYGRFNRQEQKTLALDVINLVKKQNLWGGSQNVTSI